MKNLTEFFLEMLKFGTPQCGFFCALIGGVIALLLLFIGFWQTLFVCILCVLGAFLGGVKDKSAFIKKLINKCMPPPQQ